MPTIRSLSRRILRFAVRRSPRPLRNWGRAMLREMDFVENDWAAASWALGSTVTVARQTLFHFLEHGREGDARRAWSRQRRVRWVASVLVGVTAAATVLVVSMSSLGLLVRESWLAPAQGKLVEPFFVVLIPDAICVAGAIALWRPLRRVASGILAAAAALAAHSIIYFVA